MNSARLIFAVVLPLMLSACMNTCNCNDVSPTWSYAVGLEERAVLDVDAGFYVDGPDFLCTATMTSSAHAISFDVGPGTNCTKTGGDPTSDCSIDYYYEDAGMPVTVSQLARNATVVFHLDAADQEYLGSVDFDFDIQCGSEVFAGYLSRPLQGHESFTTRICAD
ncbi:MAG: hypothetical protein ABI183_00745 [Polyangiaceae bacterium]